MKALAERLFRDFDLALHRGVQAADVIVDPGIGERQLGGLALQRDATLAVARTFDQPHPVFALVRRDVHAHLERFLANGGRKIDAWYATLRVTEVPFDDEADAFRNINTIAELAAAGPR